MRRIRRLFTVAAILAMAWASRTTLAGEPAQFPPSESVSQALSAYLDVVDQYRSGRPGLATVRALGWTRGDVEAFRRAISDSGVSVEVARAGRGSVAAADIETAILLHTDASLAFADVGDGDGAWLHLDAAQSLLNWLEQLSVSRPSLRIRPVLVPRRDWYEAAVTALNGARMPELAEPLVATAIRDYPSDSGMLLAAAVNGEARALIQEQLGDLGEQLGTPSLSSRAGQQDQGRYDVLRFLETRRRDLPSVRALRLEALVYLSGVLAADRAHADAHLRSGRLLALVGQADKAQEELATLAAGDAAVEIRFLAWLFLGGVHEAAGRLPDAEAAYVRAAELQPLAQSARMALAYVRTSLNRRADAQTALGPALDARRPVTLTSDPFWTYPFGHPVTSRAKLEGLRARVMR